MSGCAFEMPDPDRASFCDGTNCMVIAVANVVPLGIEEDTTVALVACAAEAPFRSQDFPRLVGAGLREGRYIVLLLTLQTGPRETVELTSSPLDPRVPTDLERIEAIMSQSGINVFFVDRDTAERLGHTWVSLNRQGVAYFDAFTQTALQTI